jgi:methylmalonyl-CoA/ethylmalonyl-CoA epimerase
MSESFGLSTIGQIAVPVRDLARAVAFYRDTLGMRFLFEFPGLAFFECGGVRLLLEVPEAEEDNHHASVIYYKVEDIEAATQTLKERGVSLTDEPHIIAELDDHVLWMAFFRDLEDNMLALMSEVPKN